MEPNTDTADEPGIPSDALALKLLHNLGYDRHEDEEDNVTEFQIDIGKSRDELTGQLADIKEELKRRHDNLSPPPRAGRLGNA
jgi:hypothetical protein